MTTPQGSSEFSPTGASANPDVSGVSVGQLISEVTTDLSTLMRQELALAKAELKVEASKAGQGAGFLTGAAVAGYLTLLFLSIALWWGLGRVVTGHAWSALIVAVLWGIVAAVLASMGRKKLKEVQPTPQRTVETLKEVPDALKGR